MPRDDAEVGVRDMNLLATMSPAELRMVMLDLDCSTQQRLARRIGVSRSCVGHWITGKAGIPLHIAMLLRMLAA